MAGPTLLENVEIVTSHPSEPTAELAADVTGVNSATTSPNDTIILEPVEERPYDLSYACLLLPRFSSHLLMGDIVTSLETWMKQICISFGWRLEFVNIKPGHLQWTMRVPPTASTTQFMQIIREQTSQHIFADFPRFKRENASSDFWAPGYLIVWGAQPHPEEIIQRYTLQTRQQQGLQPDE